MSKSDPYAAYERDVVQATSKPPVDEPVKAPEGSVSEVLNWVGSDPERARVALEAEKSGNNRKTLVAKLEELAPRDAVDEDLEPGEHSVDEVDEAPVDDQEKSE